MKLTSRLFAGFFALAIACPVALPMAAHADDWGHHHWWSDHDWDHDHDRDRRDYRHGEPRHLPANGEGMINRRNPNLVWACDSEGHHCHWARRWR